MKFPRNPLLHTLVLSLFAASSAYSADAIWTGGALNGTWTVAGNWSAATPSTGNTVTFNNAGSGNTSIDLDIVVTVAKVIFDSPSVAAYVIGSSSAQSFRIDDSGTITVQPTVSNQQRFNASVVLGITSDTASYSFTNNSATIGNLLTFAGDISSGTSNTNNTTKTLTLGGTANGLISGQISGDGSNGKGKTAFVELTKTGTGVWELQGANTYSGQTTVSAGTLLANNSSGSATGTGPVTVASLGTLGGNGTITPTAGNISVSGVLAPGASVGTTGNLTLNLSNTTGTVVMNSGASFQYDLGAAGLNIGAVGTSDLLVLAGANTADVLTFSGNSINFGGTGAVGYYKLFDSGRGATATWGGALAFNTTTGLITSGLTVQSPSLASGLSGNLIMGGVGTLGAGGDVGDIYLQVVPEPSAALLGGIGVLALLRRRRVG